MKVNLKRERLFWALQCLGWFGTRSFDFLIYELSWGLRIYAFLTGSIIGITVTSVYRVYLKFNVDTEVFDRDSIIRFVVAFFACCCLYFSLDQMADLLYRSVEGLTSTEEAIIAQYTNPAANNISLLLIIFSWTLIYFIIKFALVANENNLRSLELNATLREAQLNSLKGQVNPHFMFNSLNNIRALMLEDVVKSQVMITKLSEMLDYALEKNTVDSILLKDELEMVENYIALSKIQMEERLTFKKDIDPSTLELSIPPMIIQLLVENAAKHGISTLKDGGTIRLDIKKNNEELTMLVANTGHLKLDSNSTQLGLKNIRQRLRLLYGSKSSFQLEEIAGQVVATIKIPIE